MSPQQNDRIKRREFLQNQFLKAQNNVKKEIDSKLKQEIKEILQETCVKRPGFLYRSQKQPVTTRNNLVATQESFNYRT